MMDMMGGANGGWMLGGMWLMSGLWWTLIIAGLVFIVWWLAGGRGDDKTSRDESSLELLKRRYANGEIDRQTFESMKKYMT